jgi:hypothetical protein
VVISPLATGAGCLIQSSFGTEVPGNVGNFEVVVQQGSELVHYWHGNSEAALAWQRAQDDSTATTGPGCIIQSTLTSAPGQPGNLEVVVPEGTKLTHYTSDSSRPGSPRRR